MEDATAPDRLQNDAVRCFGCGVINPTTCSSLGQKAALARKKLGIPLDAVLDQRARICGKCRSTGKHSPKKQLQPKFFCGNQECDYSAAKSAEPQLTHHQLFAGSVSDKTVVGRACIEKFGLEDGVRCCNSCRMLVKRERKKMAKGVRRSCDDKIGVEGESLHMQRRDADEKDFAISKL